MAPPATNQSSKEKADRLGKQFISMWWDKAHLRRVDKAAKHLGVSRSELIRVATQASLVEHELWTLRGRDRDPSAPRQNRRRKITIDELRREVDD